MEVKEMILQFIVTYGWQLALIACSGIFVVGILKFFKVFDKIDKSKRKYLYAGLSASISIIASAIYLVATGGFDWGGFGIIAVAIYGINQTIYSVYENTGARSALRAVGSAFIHFVAGKEIEQAKQDIIDDMQVAKDVEENKEKA